MSTDQEIYIRHLEWALVQIMDGIKDHEIQAETGLRQNECDKIAEIRAKALKSQSARKG